jgi:hypothetical protein
MELRQLGEQLGIDNRTVRYVVEQKLVPDLKLAPGRGARRVLTVPQARKVALAAMLHEAGLRSEKIRAMVTYMAGALSRWAEDLQMPGNVQITIDMRKVYQVLR